MNNEHHFPHSRRIEGYLEPKDAPKEIATADKLYKFFDEVVAKNLGKKGDIGELIKVTKFSFREVSAAIFDISSGQQIGYAGVMLLESQRNFTTGVAISSNYQSRGYGYLAAKYMHLLVANYSLQGAPFFEANTANNQKSRMAVERILRRLQMNKISQNVNGERIDGWLKFEPNTRLRIPFDLTGDYLTFSVARPKDMKNLKIGKEIIRDGKNFIYQDRVIGNKDEHTINILKPQNPADITFWRGVDLFWKNLASSGFQTDLRF